MSVRVVPYRTGGWEVDVRVVLPDGSRRRDRKKLAVSSKSGARRWAEARERELLIHRPIEAPPRKEVPTLQAFAQRFLDGYARANRHKPSGIASKDTILRVHLVPLLGTKRLDAISNEDVQRLKARLGTKAPKTVNNVLTVLNTLLKTAVEWDLIEQVPCSVRLLRAPVPVAAFHDFDAFERLVEATTHEQDGVPRLIVLLGGEAGLRCGEIVALEWPDVNLATGSVSVQRAVWNGHVTVPKGGRVRHVPLTTRLSSAFRSHRHLRGERVLMTHDGRVLTHRRVQTIMARVARRAQVPRGVHILRHTFCSHLAMRGAPARAIQELAGHRDLSTTQRYMHLSPAAKEAAIRLLDEPPPFTVGGEIGETRSARSLTTTKQKG